MNLSEWQQAIIDFVQDDDAGHGIVSAYAGSGKTFVLERVAEAIDDEESMFFGAFNTPIAAELTKRIRRANTEIRTLHSLGFVTLKRHWGKDVNLPQEGVDYLGNIIEAALPKKIDPDIVSDVRKLVEKSMAFVADDNPAMADERITDLMYRFQCGPADERTMPAEQYVAWARKVLVKLREQSNTICFSQMVYVPAFFKWSTGHFRRVAIDETQDMNRGQLIVAKNALHQDGRFLAVGDRWQAIYAWNGADSGSMDKIKKTFKAKEMKLPISYRAPEAVATRVRNFIPDFHARPGAPQGLVKVVDSAFMLANWKPTDFYLSRKNAPLPKACLAALKSGVPAYIRGGKDMTKGFYEIIRKSRKTDIRDFVRWAKEYAEKRCAVLLIAKQEKSADELADTVAALVELSDGCDSTNQLRARLDSLFSDTETTGKLMVSSVHKAKGLETPEGAAVWLDNLSFRSGDEEDRIRYVAETRTRDKLYLVQDK